MRHRHQLNFDRKHISASFLDPSSRPVVKKVEKLKMLKNGTLTKPIDIFDLFYHLIPPVISLLKGLKGPKCIKITSWKFPALSGQ